MKVSVVKNLLAAYDRIAQENSAIFDEESPEGLEPLEFSRGWQNEPF